MKLAGTEKVKISERISAVVASETPFRTLARNFSKVAESALNEANSLSIEEIRINLKRLPKKLDGLKIVQLSDLHHSPFTNINHIEKAVQVANDLEPDLFILTGDYVSHEPEYIEPVAEVLGELRSEFGTFACLGNHDHWTDADLVTKSFRQNGIAMLINEGFRFTACGESFWLCGVDDYMLGKTDIRAALRGSLPNEMKLLLAHNPAILSRAAYANVDLMLSGHTHGGQVKLREPRERILFPNRKRRLRSGLHHRKNTQIYITRGIGTVVLPVRYQCPPEISVLELRATNY
ncbi:MAG: metallophosphoesterase [Blastocatellia bacterium]|nr:metallophosphoesterase [Blastocatellia bacterium]